jgi:hypothetical protein
MANLDFTRQDIVDLIRKLSTLQPYFSEKECALLLAIFGAAAERARSSGVSGATLPEAGSSGQTPGAGTGGSETIASLQQQLLSAYIPGNSFDAITGGGGGGRLGRITEDADSLIPPTGEPQAGAQAAEAPQPASGDPGASQPKTKNNK